MRYTYNVTIADSSFECADVSGVVETVNAKAGFPAVTKAMIYSLFTRPHKANKRLFGPGKIDVGRERHLTKAERERAKVARIRAENAALRKRMASEAST